MENIINKRQYLGYLGRLWAVPILGAFSAPFPRLERGARRATLKVSCNRVSYKRGARRAEKRAPMPRRKKTPAAPPPRPILCLFCIRKNIIFCMYYITEYTRRKTKSARILALYVIPFKALNRDNYNELRAELFLLLTNIP